MVDYVAVGVRWEGDSRRIRQARAIPGSLEQRCVKLLRKNGKRLLAKGNRAARDPRSKGKIYGRQSVGRGNGFMVVVEGKVEGGGEAVGGGRCHGETCGRGPRTLRCTGGGRARGANRGLQGSGQSRPPVCPYLLAAFRDLLWCPPAPNRASLALVAGGVAQQTCEPSPGEQEQVELFSLHPAARQRDSCGDEGKACMRGLVITSAAAMGGAPGPTRDLGDGDIHEHHPPGVACGHAHSYLTHVAKVRIFVRILYRAYNTYSDRMMTR